MSETTIDWRAISAKLQEPFNPADVDFRVQGRVNEQTGKGQVVAYIDARLVQDRLDEVVGAGAWTFDWQPLVIDKGDVQVAKGTLTIHGVSKSDAGTASNFEATLGAVSHCFKRAAVHWGIGRYLYDLPAQWVSVEKNGRISSDTLRELRAKLPRPGGMTQNAPVRAPQPNLSEQREKTTASTSASPAPSQRVPESHAVQLPAVPGVWPATATATKDQRERMRKYREALEISDDSIARADNLLDQTAAEGRISEYIRMWQRRNVVGTGASA